MEKNKEYICVCLGCVGLVLIWWLLQIPAVVKVLEGSGHLAATKNFP